MSKRKPLAKVKEGAKPKNKRKEEPRPRKGLTAGFLVFVLVFLAGTAVFMLVQHRYAIRNDLSARKLDSKIASEKSRQERLRLSIAKLKSPGRVARIASDELGMMEPSGVIYLKYARDEEGRMVCQSTFEKRGPPEEEAVEEDLHEEEDGQEPVVEGPEPITRR
jgi:cell division protein FtsL